MGWLEDNKGKAMEADRPDDTPEEFQKTISTLNPKIPISAEHENWFKSTYRRSNAPNLPKKNATEKFDNLNQLALHWLRAMYKTRMARSRIFGEDLFSEPGWDMLCLLVADDLDGRKVSVSGLCYASGAPPSTALRHIAKLEHSGLIVRQDDNHDHRRVWVKPTERAIKCIMECMITCLEMAGAAPRS